MKHKNRLYLLLIFCVAAGAALFAFTANSDAENPPPVAKEKLVDYFAANHWSHDAISTLFGKPVKQIDAFDYYPSGIRIKLDDNQKVFALIADRSYKGEIVPGVTTSTTKPEVTGKLGNPAFHDQANQLVGYQYTGYYLFFTFDNDKIKEISVYRRDQLTDVDKLIDAAQNLQAYADKLSFPMDHRDFSLFQRWGNPDFTHHLHGIGSYAWEYPSRGIAYDGVDEDANLTIYRNDWPPHALDVLRGKKNVIFSTDDAILLKEQERIAYEKEKVEKAKEHGILSPDKLTIALIDADGLYSSANIRFYNKDYTPIAQVFPGYFIDQVVWLDNQWVAYFTMQSMGVFHTASGTNQIILTTEKSSSTPMTIFDVNAITADPVNNNLIFERTDNRKPYVLHYELKDNHFLYTW